MEKFQKKIVVTTPLLIDRWGEGHFPLSKKKKSVTFQKPVIGGVTLATRPKMAKINGVEGKIPKRIPAPLVATFGQSWATPQEGLVPKNKQTN